MTYYSGFVPDHTKERLLPDGAVEIIVDLTDTPKHLYDRDDHSHGVGMRKAWISGMRRRWIVIEAAPDSSMLVIRFKPGGAYPFLGFDVEGLNDEVQELDTVVGESSWSLRDRILEAATVEGKLAAVEGWLLERAGDRLEASPVIEYITGRLFAPAGLRITDVVDEIGYSQRHVLGMFRRWVGLPPKQYGRIRRFQQVLTAVTSDVVDINTGLQAGYAVRPAEPDWADVALGHGYYDQSHLVRDFRQFSGLTPRGYLDAFRGSENYLPID